MHFHHKDKTFSMTGCSIKRFKGELKECFYKDTPAWRSHETEKPQLKGFLDMSTHSKANLLSMNNNTFDANGCYNENSQEKWVQ